MNKKQGNSSVDANNKKSRSHILHTIGTKMEIIKRSEGGESFASIARSYNINRSTICSILKNKNKLKDYVKNYGNTSSKIVSKRHNVVMDEMERSLSSWIKDQHQKDIPITFPIIQTVALSLYEEWKIRLNYDSNIQFRASKGWFDKFKIRYSLNNLKSTGGASDTDKNVVNKFITSLSKIIEDEDFSPWQIFNVDETGLFWKKMPDCTFLSNEESVTPGYKSSENRLSLLLGGNLAGDLKLKPMLIYHSENPRALKGKDKNFLPVIWKSSKKACITALIFKEWFICHFVPTVEQYCNENNLKFKALLILDNAPRYPEYLQNLYPEIKVIFLPPNTTSLIQPMDQTVTTTFKRYYTRAIMKQAIKATNKESGPTLKEFWRKYNIRNAIYNIGDAWAEIKESTLNLSWKKLCPQMMTNHLNLEESEEPITNEIVVMMNELNLNVKNQDVDELIKSHSEPWSNEYSIEEQEDIKMENEDEEVKGLTLNNMNEAFMHLDRFLDIIDEYDPNLERVSQVRRAIERDTACYRTLYEEMKEIEGIQQSF